MEERRIRGEEVVVRLAVNSEIKPITAFRDCSITYDLAVIDQAYIGETTNRKDDIFNGVSGSVNADHESADLIYFCDFLAKRAQRLIPAASSRCNITARFTFPNGQTPRLLIRDAKFEALTINVAGREAYVNTPFPFKSENRPKILP